jgi:hypothetical protein
MIFRNAGKRISGSGSGRRHHSDTVSSESDLLVGIRRRKEVPGPKEAGLAFSPEHPEFAPGLRIDPKP